MNLILYIYNMWYQVIGVSTLPADFSAYYVVMAITWITFISLVWFLITAVPNIFKKRL